MKRHCVALLGLLVASAGLQAAGAAAVHKWIDEQGVTHYADAPPDGGATTLIELPAAAIAGSARDEARAADDYYSIANQWQRMNRERLERERLQLERQKIRAARPAPVAVADDGDDAIRYLPVYPGFGLHRPQRTHRHHHGGLRPPTPARAGSGLGTFPTR